MSVDHDWTTDPDIVVRTQMAISVYLNQFGELVIRRQGQPYQGEDGWVVIAPANVSRVIAAMQETIGVTAPETVTDRDTVTPTQGGLPREAA